MRREMTRAEAFPAANALLGINHPDIAVGRVDVTCPGGAVFHAQRVGTLPAYVYLDVIGILRQDGPRNLDARQGRAGGSIMHE